MIAQLVNKAIPIFESSFPGFQVCFLFDNSSNHGVVAPDALIASKMNLNPGGRQPKLRDGYDSGKGCSQSMVFPDDHPQFPGQPKGIRQALMERGIWRQGLKLDCAPQAKCPVEGNCCARTILAHQEDFRNQLGRVEEEVIALGHICLFYPKFHCGLNFIEPYWGAAKKFARDNCDYTFSGLRKTVPSALASVSNVSILRFYRKCIRTMDAYREDVRYGTKEFRDRVYKSHRRVDDRDKW